MKNLDELDPADTGAALDRYGYAHVPGVLSDADCQFLRTLYEDDTCFRSTINMERYRFGIGEYKYFAYPMPDLIVSLRKSFYPKLVPVANGWMEKLHSDIRYPTGLGKFIDLCHDRNQTRPTPLILKYQTGGYNTLHQDLYGDVFFPFQMVIMLTKPNEDFAGGEFVLVEQLPRAQSRVRVLSPDQGDAIIFTTNFRPVKGTRGYYKARMKHGVSTVTAGVRYTMGIIFHDAK